MNITDLAGGWGQARSYGPDGLISNNRLSGGGIGRQRPGYLCGDYVQGSSLSPLRQALTNADNGQEPCPLRSQGLGPYVRVGFTMFDPALGMAQNHRRGASVLQHFRCNIAGMRTLGLRMAILAAEPYWGLACQAMCSHEQRSGRTDENIAIQPHAFEHGGQQPQLSERGNGPVHFPVSRHKGAGPPICRHGSSLRLYAWKT